MKVLEKAEYRATYEKSECADAERREGKLHG